jgi:phospholipase C
MAGAGALGLSRPGGIAGALEGAARRAVGLPDPGDAPFDHVVVLMFENRSFDHLLGWLPGADGVQAGLQFTDQTGTTYPTYDLTPDNQGCGYADPDHSWEGFVTQFNGGALDGWLRTAPGRGEADTFPIGYYGPEAVPAIASIAQSYTVLDRYFASFAGETFPNRFYQHAARTDRDHNMGITTTTLSPTIWDRLADAGLTAGYYFVDEPFIELWEDAYVSITHPVAQFLVDAAAGTLPNVSFVDPSFAEENEGASGDYHPHGDIRAGESFLSLIYHAVRDSPAWDKTVLVINFDEWGGFYDHVVPPQVMDDTVRAEKTPLTDPVPDYTQLGFRVPCILVSPWSASGVHHAGPYEHTSVLRMIEWRWGLAPLTVRDANAKNMAEALDFTSARDDTPDIPRLDEFLSIACGPTSTPKAPPAPVAAPPSGGTDNSPDAGGTAGTGAGSGSGGLANTGRAMPLLTATAAVTGGMAFRAAARRAQELAAAAVAPDDAEEQP